MIERVLPLQFVKKSPFFGSCKWMNYRIQKKEDELEFCVYPGPNSFGATPEEQKTYAVFPFTEEGYDQGIQYLNEQFEAGNK